MTKKWWIFYANTSQNLTHIYSEGMPYQTVALEDISFEIDDGSFVGIISHTGSGSLP